MKVEVGESIIYSWLRHIKRCQIVQLNWKTSPKWDPKGDAGYLQSLMDRANDQLGTPFKKTKNIEQLIKQAEIDGIGINIDGNNIHAVDVAFHEGGLNYGSRRYTVTNVKKKILRTVFTLEKYFGDGWNSTIYFISPKITPIIYNDAKKEIETIRDFINTQGLKSEVDLIANEDFKDKILNPIKEISGELSDTSELFLRSFQLLNLFNWINQSPGSRAV